MIDPFSEQKEVSQGGINPFQQESMLSGSELFTFGPQDLEKRTADAMYANHASPDKKALYSRFIREGEEDVLRRQDAQAEWEKQRATRMSIIKDFAEAKQGPLTPDEKFMVDELMRGRNPDYNSVWEKKWTERALHDSIQAGAIEEALREEGNERRVFNAIDLTESSITNRKIIERLKEKYNALWNQRGMFGKIGSFGENMLPLVEWWQFADANGDWSPFLGTTKKEAIDYFWSLPDAETFASELDAFVATLWEKNSVLAMGFLEDVGNQPSAMARAVESSFVGLDAYDVITLGALGASKRGLKGLKNVGAAAGEKTAALLDRLNKVEKAVQRGARPAEVLEAGGNASASAVARSADVEKAIRSIESTPISAIDMKDVSKLMHTGYSFQDFQRWRHTLDGEVLEDGVNRYAALGRCFKFLSAPDTLRHMTEDELMNGLARTSQALQKDLQWRLSKGSGVIERQIADINITREARLRPEEVRGKDTAMVEMAVVADNMKPFRSVKAAMNFARNMWLSPDDVIQIAPGEYALLYRRSVDISGGVKLSPETEQPSTWMTQHLSGIISAADLNSKFERRNRGAATAKQQREGVFLRSLADKITGLSSKSKERLAEVLEKTRDIEREFHHASSSGTGSVTVQKGDWYKDSMELQKSWIESHGRRPTEDEEAAYWAFIRMADIDYVIRNFEMYRYKAYRGYQNVIVPTRVLDPKTNELFAKNGKIEGKTIDRIPFDSKSEGSFGVALINPKTDTYKTYDRATAQQVEGSLMDLVNKGSHQIVEIANPNRTPLATTLGTDDIVHFAVVPVIRKTPLDIHQLPYHGSFHQANATQWYAKQAKFDNTGTKVIGDTTLTGFEVRGQMKDVLPKMEKIRQAVADIFKDNRAFIKGMGDTEAWDRVVKLSDELGFNYDRTELQHLFTPGKGNWSWKAPIIGVRSGDSVTHDPGFKAVMQSNSWEDARNSPWNPMAGASKEYAGERNPLVMTFAEQYDESGAVKYQPKPVRILDPFKVQAHASSSLTRERSIQRAKETTARHYVEMLAKADPGLNIDQMRQNPQSFLHDFDPMEMTQIPFETRRKLANLRTTTLHFVGHPTKTAEHWDVIKLNLIDEVYSKGGLERAERLTPWQLSTTKDPFKFLRAVGFHLKLGLLNPVQMFVQAQTFAHIAAFAGPRVAMQAVGGAFLQRLSMLNQTDQILGRMGKIAAKDLDWAGDGIDWRQADTLMNEMGWKFVEGDVTYLDDMGDVAVYRGTAAKTLDKASVFFKETERMIRMTAFNAAYIRWRRAHPDRVPNSLDKQRILERAKDYAANMTRDANASWQRGFLSTPTQFFSYQARLMDAFWGKRFDPATKRRAMLMYATLYGVPGMLGATTGIYPWGDDIRNYLIENDIGVGNDMTDEAVKFFMNGMADTGLRVMLGKDYAIQERWAPNGLPIVREWLKNPEDQRFLELAFGASGSILSDIAEDTLPLRTALWSWASGNKEKWPLKLSDFTATANNISTVAAWNRYRGAANTGKYITTNGVPFGELESFDAFVHATTGASTQAQSDAYRRLEIMEDNKQDQEAAEKYIVSTFRLAVMAIIDGDMEDAADYIVQVKAMMEMADIPMTEYRNIEKKTLDALTQDQVEAVFDKFYERDLNALWEHKYKGVTK